MRVGWGEGRKCEQARTHAKAQARVGVRGRARACAGANGRARPLALPQRLASSHLQHANVEALRHPLPRDAHARRRRRLAAAAPHAAGATAGAGN